MVFEFVKEVKAAWYSRLHDFDDPAMETFKCSVEDWRNLCKLVRFRDVANQGKRIYISDCSSIRPVLACQSWLYDQHSSLLRELQEERTHNNYLLKHYIIRINEIAGCVQGSLM